MSSDTSKQQDDGLHSFKSPPGLPSVDISNLQHIYGDDALTKEDVLRSKALTTEAEDASKYLVSVPLIGTLAATALSVFGLIWGFAPVAGIATFINADIGPSDSPALFVYIWQIALPISSIIFGRLSDKTGRRYWVLGSCVLQIVGSIVAATAHSMNTLVGANVLIGLGAGVPAIYFLIFGELLPHRLKFFFIPVAYGCALVPTGFGAYLGRYFYENYSWRVVYYIEIGIEVAAFALFALFYHPPNFRQLHGPNRSRLQEFKRIDFVGIFLLTAGLVLFLLGVSWGGNNAQTAWSSGRIIGLLTSGLVSLLAFVLWEIFSKTPVPIIPFHMFRSVKGFIPLTAVSIVSGICYTAIAGIVWPYTVQAIFGISGYSWQKVAWMSTTCGFATWFGLACLAPFTSLIRHTRWQFIIMMCWTTIFLGTMTIIDRSREGAAVALAFLFCLFIGVLESNPILFCQMVCDESELGIVVASISTFRTAMGSVFAAVFVAILTNKLPGELQSHVIPAAVGAGLPASSIPDLFQAIAAGTASAFEAVPGISPAIIGATLNAVSDGYAAAFKYVYYAALAVALFGTIISFFMPDFDPYFTNHITRQVYSRNQQEQVAAEVDEKVAMA